MKKQQKNLSVTSEIGPYNKLIEEATSVIEKYTNGKHAVVAFSGGMDSTLALLITKEVIPDVVAVHVDWGMFTYPTIRKKIKTVVHNYQIPLHVIYGEENIKKLAYRGISCNTCTKRIKLALIQKYYPNSIIITGANQSDSWGYKGGPYFNQPFLAPIKNFSKDQETIILKYKYNIEEFHIGVHPTREGCMLRHLWVPDIEGSRSILTAKINLALMQYLEENHIPHYLANVKVIGNSKTIKCIINVKPPLSSDQKNNITKILSQYVSDILWGENITKLTIVINPSLDNTKGKESIKNIVITDLVNQDVNIHFIRSKSDFIRLFQVVDAK